MKEKKQQLLLHTTDYCCAVFPHQLLALLHLLSASTTTQNSYTTHLVPFNFVSQVNYASLSFTQCLWYHENVSLTRYPLSLFERSMLHPTMSCGVFFSCRSAFQTHALQLVRVIILASFIIFREQLPDHLHHILLVIPFSLAILKYTANELE